MDRRSSHVGTVSAAVVGSDGLGHISHPGTAPPRADRDAEPTLESLMSDYVNGSSDGFDRLYRKVSPKLFGYLLRLTRNRERAEDLLQITFSKIHRARDSYLQGAPLLPWVLAIARRSFYDERRASRSRHEHLSPDGELPEPAPAEPKTRSDAAETLERALDSLPEAYREAIQLTKITGLSLNEAAEVLGTTPTAIKLRVHRGYVALRKSLDAAAAEGS
ncbi:MAG TPA: RNA polymerase sigma factor [Polyangiaceae bacterium]|nr:RNA polymerase sigma factor [Polyangiaceae bacterium]